MKNIVCKTAILILFFSSIVMASTTVRKHPNPAKPLKEKCEWAEKEGNKNFKKGYWIGYSIEKMMNKNSFTGTFHSNWKKRVSLSEIIYGIKTTWDSDNDNLTDGEIIRREAKEALRELDDNDYTEEKVLKEIAILFLVSPEKGLNDIKISNMSLHVDFKDTPLLWLGKSSKEESVIFLKKKYDDALTNDAKEDMVSAVGIHPAGKEVFTFLENILKSKDHNDIREKAAFWLGQQDDPKALKILIHTARNDHALGVREQAVFAISQLDMKEATDALIMLANDAEDTEVREKAVFWMGQSNDPRALNALLHIVKFDNSGDVREKAVFAISQIKTDKAIKALSDLAFNAKYTNVREKAVFWLGQSNHNGALETLVKIVNQDPSSDVREQAVFAISQMKTDEAVKILIDLAYHSKSLSVRKKAIFWLGQKASKSAASALVKVAYDDDDIEIQKQAVFAISQLPGDESIPKLIKLSENHQNVKIRKKAIFWLGQTDDKRAVDALVRIIENN